MMFSTLNRYIAKRIFSGILMAFLIVTSIIMLVDFVEGSRNLGSEDNISSVTLFLLTIFKTPVLIEQTIPFVVLFGVMGALYGLNRRSELIVMRASGLSAWKFLSPAILVTTALGIIWSLAFNPLASMSLTAHDRLSARALGTESLDKDEDVWLREGDAYGQTVLHAKGTNLSNRKLTDVTFYIFSTAEDGITTFERRYDAAEAELVTQGYWQLRNVIENQEGELPKRQVAVSLPTTITLETIRDKANQQALPPIWKIPNAIKSTQQAGFSTVSLRMQLNKLLALPIMLVAMTIIAAGVSMHLTREGGTLRLLITGSVLGFAVYFADSVVTAFGTAAVLPIILAAWAIPLFVLFSALAYLSRIEDG